MVLLLTSNKQKVTKKLFINYIKRPIFRRGRGVCVTISYNRKKFCYEIFVIKGEKESKNRSLF